MTVDSAKTGLAGTTPRGNGAGENRALLIPRLNSVGESGCDIARPFAIYSNCKSIVSSIHRLHIQIFFATATNAPAPAVADAGALAELSGGDSRGASRSALHQSSE